VHEVDEGKEQKHYPLNFNEALSSSDERETWD
jgi:hypothetical protein